MRVFVTGATGFVGSALVPELLRAGHQVVGLARSETSAAALRAAGAEAIRGSIEDLDTVRAGAAGADGVMHLAESAAAEARAVETEAAALEGSGRPLVVATGVAGIEAGRVAVIPERASPVAARRACLRAALASTERGVRTSLVGLPPVVHGPGDLRGFIPRLISAAREKKVSGFVGEGMARWPAVHLFDAARLFRLALEKAPAGSAIHAVGDEGIPVRTIAEAIGRRLNVPVTSIAPDAAGPHFGLFVPVLSLDVPGSRTFARELLGWEPSHPGLLADLEEGHYFQ